MTNSIPIVKFRQLVKPERFPSQLNRQSPTLAIKRVQVQRVFNVKGEILALQSIKIVLKDSVMTIQITVFLLHIAFVSKYMLQLITVLLLHLNIGLKINVNSNHCLHNMVSKYILKQITAYIIWFQEKCYNKSLFCCYT